MERIKLILQAILLEMMGTAIITAEGVALIHNELLLKMRSITKEFMEGLAKRIAVSSAATDLEKAEIEAIMNDGKVLAFGEDEVVKILSELEDLGLVEEVPPTDLLPPACGTCEFLEFEVDRSGKDKLTYCSHLDAEGVGETTENTGYVLGIQPRKQPSWCPLLPKSEKDPPATKNSFVPLGSTKQHEE